MLTKPCRTPLIREHLSLMPPDFLPPERKKVFEKLIRKKIQ